MRSATQCACCSASGITAPRRLDQADEVEAGVLGRDDPAVEVDVVVLGRITVSSRNGNATR
jgi:hypothetical protein